MFNFKNYDNDLLYLCSMIEYVARLTNNKKSYIVNKIGFDELLHQYKCACVNHCLTKEQVSDEWIKEYNLVKGDYDILSNVYEDIKIPNLWAMGKVYMRLILNTLDYEYTAKDADTNNDKESLIKHVIEVYNNWMCETIDNYNCLVFTKGQMYLWACYEEQEFLDY